MDDLLRRVFGLAYLLEPQPGPLGPLLPLYVVVGMLFGVGMVWSWRKALTPGPSPTCGRGARLARIQLVLCGVGLALVLARFGSVPVLSMRLLFYGVMLAAGGVALAAWATPSQTHLGERLRDAIAFRFDPDRPSLSWRLSLALFGLHALGLILAFEVIGRSLSLAIPVLILLLTPQVLLWPRLRRPALYAEALTPLFLVYIVLALHLVGLVLWRVLDRPGAGLRLPQPWATMLDPVPYLLLAVIAVLAYELYMVAVAWNRERGLLRTSALALLIAGLGWAAWITFSARTHGVTGSDPYAYAQMAVDLAERGAPFHVFPLAQTAQALGLPVKPALPVGYRPSVDAAGQSATVWPPGYSTLLAVAYSALGEPGLYLTTPFLGLLSLAATWALAQTVFAGRPAVQRQFMAGFAVFLLATSFEQISRTVVPLADISAQLFTTLTLLLALKVCQRIGSGLADRRVFLSTVALGIVFGCAYAVRYTQLLLAPSLLLAVAPAGRTADATRRTLYAPRLTLFAMASALLVALPDLWYHQVAFGSPLRVGSEELEQFALANIVPVMQRLVDEVFAVREFLLFAPFIALGAWRLARTDRRTLAVLLAGPLLVLLFHLPYWYLRLRDLLSLFPIAAVLAGAGVLEVVQRLARIGDDMPGATLSRFAIFLVAVALPVVRLALILPLAQGFYTFGTLLPPQRAALDRLAALTLANAVVGSSFNGGAVDLHAGRASFRPAGWTSGELQTFVQAMRAEGRPVYMLDDGIEVQAPLQTLAATYRLNPVTELPLPYFFVGGGSENRDVILYEVR
jgi:hypothetical protein